MEKTVFVQYRHGDVLVQRVASLPADTHPVPGLTLAYGEATGHSHRIKEADGRAELLKNTSDLYLRVSNVAATLVHDEHGPIALFAPGIYRVWKQREYVEASPDGRIVFIPVSD